MTILIGFLKSLYQVKKPRLPVYSADFSPHYKDLTLTNIQRVYRQSLTTPSGFLSPSIGRNTRGASLVKHCLTEIYPIKMHLGNYPECYE